jgi:hypothetical protein
VWKTLEVATVRRDKLWFAVPAGPMRVCRLGLGERAEKWKWEKDLKRV